MSPLLLLLVSIGCTVVSLVILWQWCILCQNVYRLLSNYNELKPMWDSWSFLSRTCFVFMCVVALVGFILYAMLLFISVFILISSMFSK